MALKAREKALLGSLVLVGGLIAAYMFVHEPLTARRAEARGRLETAEDQLLTETKKLKREGDLAERRALVAAREATIDSWVPGRNSAALLIWHLSQGELLSGAKIVEIRVEQKALVNVARDLADQVGRQPVAPSTDQQQEQAESQAADHTGQTEAPDQAQDQLGATLAGATTVLVMVPMELKVTGKFAEHLIFNQYLEDTSLFLNTHGLSLSRGGEMPMERVSKLVEGGNLWLAGQLLNQSPRVDGTYKVNLYFKAGKAGPSTDEMRFGSQTGRVDPFVWDAVDEFIRLLQASFQDPGRGTNASPGGGGDLSAPTGPRYPQLG